MVFSFVVSVNIFALFCLTPSLAHAGRHGPGTGRRCHATGARVRQERPLVVPQEPPPGHLVAFHTREGLCGVVVVHVWTRV